MAIEKNMQKIKSEKISGKGHNIQGIKLPPIPENRVLSGQTLGFGRKTLKAHNPADPVILDVSMSTGYLPSRMMVFAGYDTDGRVIKDPLVEVTKLERELDDMIRSQCEDLLDGKSTPPRVPSPKYQTCKGPIFQSLQSQIDDTWLQHERADFEKGQREMLDYYLCCRTDDGKSKIEQEFQQQSIPKKHENSNASHLSVKNDSPTSAYLQMKNRRQPRRQAHGGLKKIKEEEDSVFSSIPHVQSVMRHRESISEIDNLRQLVGQDGVTIPTRGPSGSVLRSPKHSAGPKRASSKREEQNQYRTVEDKLRQELDELDTKLRESNYQNYAIKDMKDSSERISPPVKAPEPSNTSQTLTAAQKKMRENIRNFPIKPKTGPTFDTRSQVKQTEPQQPETSKFPPPDISSSGYVEGEPEQKRSNRLRESKVKSLKPKEEMPPEAGLRSSQAMGSSQNTYLGRKNQLKMMATQKQLSLHREKPQHPAFSSEPKHSKTAELPKPREMELRYQDKSGTIRVSQGIDLGALLGGEG